MSHLWHPLKPVKEYKVSLGQDIQFIQERTWSSLSDNTLSLALPIEMKSVIVPSEGVS